MATDLVQEKDVVVESVPSGLAEQQPQSALKAETQQQSETSQKNLAENDLKTQSAQTSSGDDPKAQGVEAEKTSAEASAQGSADVAMKPVGDETIQRSGAPEDGESAASDNEGYYDYTYDDDDAPLSDPAKDWLLTEQAQGELSGRLHPPKRLNINKLQTGQGESIYLGCTRDEDSGNAGCAFGKFAIPDVDNYHLVDKVEQTKN
ncbi:unnamed protein product [Cylicocyclus nassatus]|uniref:Uncharacterized protein n=1 Tax=Cylicocyclus nassatus TaxID=53992 RepID=A0AA36DR43_CYLNA|nr:unnamed protein product [Cylicocyclus nassatus]